MRILGVDPGIARTGWGVIETENSKFKIYNYGCIETSSALSIDQRLKMLYEELLLIIEKYKPEVLSIEELFFNTNAKTAFVVGQARGVVLLVGAQRELLIAVYTPLQVKIAVTGYGRAEKDQVGKMIKTILALDKIPKPDDVTDAMAIALTHAFSAKFNANK